MQGIFNLFKTTLLLFLSTLTLCAIEGFVQPKDLYNLLDDPELVILDLSSKENFKRSHISNALHLDPQRLSVRENGDVALAPKEKLQEIFAAFALKPSSTIVLYTRNTQEDFRNASLGALALISYGFENVAILDGGYLAWAFENELLISSEKSPSPAERDARYEQKHAFIEHDLAKEDATVLFDVRSPEIYFGIAPSKNCDQTGHIPHAINIPLAYNLRNDRTLLDKETLLTLYKEGLGLNEEDTITIYGEDLLDAAWSWFLLYKHLGFTNTKVYAKGIKGWREDPNNELIRYKWETK